MKLFIVTALAVLAVACASSSGPSAANCPSPAAAATAAATAAPTKAPVASTQPVTVGGHGNSRPEVDLPKGYVKVDWTAKGHSNFSVRLIRSDGLETLLVNEIPPDPSSGESFIRLAGGHYELDISASALDWTITFTRVGD